MNTNRKDLIAKALLALAAVGLLGCAEQASLIQTDASSSYLTGGSPLSDVSNSAANSLPLIGVVYADASQQAAFQSSVNAFVSSVMPEQNLGTVSSQLAGTGMMFAGKVTFANNAALSQSTGWASLTVASTSVLRVDVYHTMQNVTGKPQIAFTQATGYLQGSNVYLRFMNKRGIVQMNGQIANQRFQGSFQFDNSMRYDGARPGAAGTIGNFDVPACDFFRCY